MIEKFVEFVSIFERTRDAITIEKHNQIREIFKENDCLFEKLVTDNINHFTPRNLALSYLMEQESDEQKFSHN